ILYGCNAGRDGQAYLDQGHAKGIGYFYRALSDLAPVTDEYDRIGNLYKYFYSSDDRRIPRSKKLRDSGCVYFYVNHLSGRSKYGLNRRSQSFNYNPFF